MLNVIQNISSTFINSSTTNYASEPELQKSASIADLFVPILTGSLFAVGVIAHNYLHGRISQKQITTTPSQQFPQKTFPVSQKYLEELVTVYVASEKLLPPAPAIGEPQELISQADFPQERISQEEFDEHINNFVAKLTPTELFMRQVWAKELVREFNEVMTNKDFLRLDNNLNSVHTIKNLIKALDQFSINGDLQEKIDVSGSNGMESSIKADTVFGIFLKFYDFRCADDDFKQTFIAIYNSTEALDRQFLKICQKAARLADCF